MPGTADDQITAVAALEEPTRRRLYDYVARAAGPVGRDEASSALDISRSTAAFHLDRLAETGLLAVTHQRLSGRSGPGAGRPAKLYSGPVGQVEVSLPKRRYELAGEVLAGAVEESDSTGRPLRETVGSRAYDAGRGIGATASQADAVPVLEAHGFEPRVEDGIVRLGNCPFHNLAQRHTELVCGMNQRLLEGLLVGLGDTGHRAVLAPSPPDCCVVLEPAPSPG